VLLLLLLLLLVLLLVPLPPPPPLLLLLVAAAALVLLLAVLLVRTVQVVVVLLVALLVAPASAVPLLSLLVALPAAVVVVVVAVVASDPFRPVWRRLPLLLLLAHRRRGYDCTCVCRMHMAMPAMTVRDDCSGVVLCCSKPGFAVQEAVPDTCRDLNFCPTDPSVFYVTGYAMQGLGRTSHVITAACVCMCECRRAKVGFLGFFSMHSVHSEHRFGRAAVITVYDTLKTSLEHSSWSPDGMHIAVGLKVPDAGDPRVRRRRRCLCGAPVCKPRERRRTCAAVNRSSAQDCRRRCAPPLRRRARGVPAVRVRRGCRGAGERGPRCQCDGSRPTVQGRAEQRCGTWCCLTVR
jgi:hypothetical protein